MARAKGIDISSWQHPGGAPIDYEAVAGAGYTFVIIKATQGISYVNPWLEADYSDAYAAGLLVGAYHFFDPGADPAAQAQAFVGALVGKHLDMHAWLDFEPAPTSEWTAAQWVNGFLEAVKDGRPGCGLYCDEQWADELRKANVNPPALWLAAPSLADAPAGATIWQRAPGRVPGVPAEVDVDELVSTRGVNIPTAPAPKPSAATVTSVVPVAQPGEDEADEHPEVGG